MAEQKKIGTPKLLQNLVKSLYFVAFSLILSFFFVIAGYFFYGVLEFDIFPTYIFAQIIVFWAYLNGNLKLPEYEW